MSKVHRVTMFKIPDADNQKKMVEACHVMKSEALKDGKPYMLSLNVGGGSSGGSDQHHHTEQDDLRSQGFTVVAETEFASLEDMRFYEEECGAHANLKTKARNFGIVGGPATGVCSVWFFV